MQSCVLSLGIKWLIKDHETARFVREKATHFSCPIILVCFSTSTTSSIGAGLC